MEEKLIILIILAFAVSFLTANELIDSASNGIVSSRLIVFICVLLSVMEVLRSIFYLVMGFTQ